MLFNKKRSGDENIWKLIVFSITIVIAIWLVGLVSYFYNTSRQQAVDISVLSSINSSSNEIQGVVPDCSGTGVQIQYNAITNQYSMTLEDNETAVACEAGLSGIKWVRTSTVTGNTVTYEIIK